MSACDSCAFAKKGSGGASDEPKNRLKGLLCAHGPIPFFCHHSKSGPEYDWREGKLGPFELPPSERKICEGWRRAVAELKARGAFFAGENAADRAALLRYQRGLASEATRELDTFTQEKDPEKKAVSHERLKDLCRAVLDVGRAETQ